MSAPARFGRYRVERRIGSGSFATVWLAHDEVLEAPVAVKVLADNWAHRLDVRARFEEEARILRRADSDRVVRVHDIGELDDGRPYFVMTYADRGTLADRLADGPLPAPVALRYGADVARGLAVLHEVGVIHRDVNPANVLLRSGRAGVGDRVLVADLGLAKAAAQGSGVTQTVGTPGYMAPEQASGEGISKRTDVYAVGALLWHLLTGAAPVAGEPLPPVSPVDLPAPVGAVLRQALARRPEDRFPSAGALADALDAAAIELARTPIARTPTARTPSARTPTARTKAAPTEPAGADAAPTEPTRAKAAPTEPMPTESSPTETALDATQFLRRDQVRLADPDEPGAAAPPRGRRRWIAVAAVLVLLATGTTAYFVVRARQTVAVVAESGLTVEVPASWAKQQQSDDWDLTSFGAAGKRGPALLVAGDVARWRDPSSTTPGVFVGVARGVAATSLWAASAAGGCPHTEQTRTLSSGLTGQVRRYECPGAPTRVTEAVLTRPGATELVFVQVKEPVADDAADTVLDSVNAQLS